MKGLLSAFFLLAVFVLGAVAGHQAGTEYRTHLLQMEAGLLDRSLKLWSMSRMVPENGETWNTYPSSLQELGDIPYPSGEWPCRILSMGAPLYVHSSRFSYRTQKDGNGAMSYRLEVTLPNGYNFRSPGSRL